MIRIINDNYLFEMANATKQETGLPYDIWIDSVGINKNVPHNIARLKIDVDGELIPISISKKPQILVVNKKIKKFNQIEEFIMKNYDVLIAHWNKELTDLETLNAITNRAVEE